MSIDDSIRIVEKAKRKAALEKIYDQIGDYLVEQFYIMSDVKNKGKYQLKLNDIEKRNMERYLIEHKKTEAKKLMANSKLEKTKILNGEADFEIFKQFNIIKAELMSVKQSKEIERQELKTKTKKEERNTRVAKVAAVVLLAGTMVASGILGYAGIKKVTKEIEVDNAIGHYVSEYPNDPRNIVAQNYYTVGFDDTGVPIIAYDNEGIAKDILKVCSHDLNLFDLCVYNAYDNMNFNRLENMDEVIKFLKIHSKDVAGLETIYNRVDNCSVFLDYIVNRGFLNPNDKDYYETLEDIAIYKELAKTSENAYYGLSDDAQERIEDLMQNYRANDNNLYEEYKDNLEGLGTFGSR